MLCYLCTHTLSLSPFQSLDPSPTPSHNPPPYPHCSIFHLCKTIIMENTKAHPSVQGWEDPHNSKYYLVIVQVGPGRTLDRG